MKYFRFKGKDYHCDDVFNWFAIDKDGTTWLFEKKPTLKIEEGYWTSGHTDSFDMQVWQKEYTNNPYWISTLQKLT